MHHFFISFLFFFILFVSDISFQDCLSSSFRVSSVLKSSVEYLLFFIIVMSCEEGL